MTLNRDTKEGLELLALDDYIDIHVIAMVKELQEWSDTTVLPDGHVRKAASQTTIPVATLQFVKNAVQRKAMERLVVYQQELEKCHDQAQYIASLNPDHVGVWRGSISERIRAGVEILDSQRELG